MILVLRYHQTRYLNVFLFFEDLVVFQNKECALFYGWGVLKCLGNEIGYDKNYHLDVKSGKSQTICETVYRIFINNERQGTVLWMTTKKQENIIQTLEEELNDVLHLTNEDNREGLQVPNSNDRLKHYK